MLHRLRRPGARRPALLATLAVLLAGVLSACSQLQGTNEGGYITGGGQVVQYARDNREAPIELTGQTLEGDRLDLAALRGEVVVVNVWWSGCAPCRKEMPMLVEAEQELGEGVEFVGINTRDPSTAQALSFQENLGVGYPSIYAADGQALLAFSGVTNLRNLPTTLVLDREGRVAAVINGEIPSKGTLTAVVEEVAAEDA